MRSTHCWDRYNTNRETSTYLDPLRLLVYDGDLDVMAFVRDDGAGGSSHVPGTQAADLGHGHVRNAVGETCAQSERGDNVGLSGHYQSLGGDAIK